MTEPLPPGDRYRAECGPEGGCRNCGAAPSGRFRYYCGAACRDEFEQNHFWGTARWGAVERASGHRHPQLSDEIVRSPAAVLGDPTCACCGRGHFGEGEVNHIAPVNGERSFFGCQNHQDNLEVLCHQCHVMATREQRRRGYIGQGGTQESMRAIDLLSGIAEPVRDRQVTLV